MSWINITKEIKLDFYVKDENNEVANREVDKFIKEGYYIHNNTEYLFLDNPKREIILRARKVI
jgi:hypothetical protein